MGDLERLPGTRFTPTVALHRALQRVDNIMALVIVEQDTEGRWWVTRTAMSNGDMCSAALVCMDNAQSNIMGRTTPEPAPDLPPQPQEKA